MQTDTKYTVIVQRQITEKVRRNKNNYLPSTENVNAVIQF